MSKISTSYDDVAGVLEQETLLLVHTAHRRLGVAHGLEKRLRAAGVPASRQPCIQRVS